MLKSVTIGDHLGLVFIMMSDAAKKDNTGRLCETWWRHQMETFSTLLALCTGNSPVNSPQTGQWRGALMFSLWARWRLKSPASRLFTQPFIQGTDQRKRQSSSSLAFVRGIHRWPVNSPRKRTATRKRFPFDDIIMTSTFTGTVMTTFASHVPAMKVLSQLIWRNKYGKCICSSWQEIRTRLLL